MRLISAAYLRQPVCLLKALTISVAALDKRAGYFASMGCKAADQSLASPDFTVGSQQEARQAFLAAMNGETPTPAQVNAYHRQLMLRLGRIYHKYVL